jgi:dolichol-phosphate mannosyltransferase
MPISTVVIPTYNERDNLPRLVSRVLAFGPQVNVLVVDDNSPDGTGQLADSLAATSSQVHVLHRPGKLGLGTAYIEGFRWALEHGADYIFSMDGDRSHDPKYLPRFWRGLDRWDVVIGSRYVRGISVIHWPLHRLALSYCANLYLRNATGLRVRDCTSGYVGYRRSVLETIRLEKVRSEGYAFLVEMKFRAHQKFRLGEVPIVFVERRRGISKLSRRVMVEAFCLPWRLAPARLLRREP